MHQVAVNDGSMTFKSFCSTALDMHMLAAKLGSNFRVFSDLSETKLLHLPESELTAITKRLKIYKDVFQIASEQKEIFNNIQEKQLLWFALRSLKLVPPSDFFNILQSNHVVEVYMGHRQVYRTFNFYSLCSYSLDELETTHWEQLFIRQDPTIVEKIHAELAVALAERRTVHSQIPCHHVVEANSAFRNEVMYEFAFIAPLTDLNGDAQDCFMAVSSIKLVNTTNEFERRRRQEEYESKRFAELNFLTNNV